MRQRKSPRTFCLLSQPICLVSVLLDPVLFWAWSLSRNILFIIILIKEKIINFWGRWPATEQSCQENNLFFYCGDLCRKSSRIFRARRSAYRPPAARFPSGSMELNSCKLPAIFGPFKIGIFPPGLLCPLLIGSPCYQRRLADLL